MIDAVSVAVEEAVDVAVAVEEDVAVAVEVALAVAVAVEEDVAVELAVALDVDVEVEEDVNVSEDDELIENIDGLIVAVFVKYTE